MEPTKTTKLRLLLVVVLLAVVLAGCSSGGGGNGNGAGTATPEDGNGDATETEVDDTETATMTETVTATETATEVVTETLTPTPTPEETATESGDFSSWTLDDHLSALREAESYTVNNSLETEREASLVSTEKVDVETGKRHSIMTSITSRGNFTTEFYVPPNSDTAYKYERDLDRIDEVSPDEASISGYPQKETSADVWSEFRKEGSGETELGSATIYVMDDVDATAESFREQWDSVESIELRIWVDDDTDVIAKYETYIEYVDDGDEGYTETTMQLIGLGSTEIEEPDWVPEDDSE